MCSRTGFAGKVSNAQLTQAVSFDMPSCRRRRRTLRRTLRPCAVCPGSWPCAPPLYLVSLVLLHRGGILRRIRLRPEVQQLWQCIRKRCSIDDGDASWLVCLRDGQHLRSLARGHVHGASPDNGGGLTQRRTRMSTKDDSKIAYTAHASHGTEGCAMLPLLHYRRVAVVECDCSSSSSNKLPGQRGAKS